MLHDPKNPRTILAAGSIIQVTHTATVAALLPYILDSKLVPSAACMGAGGLLMKNSHVQFVADGVNFDGVCCLCCRTTRTWT
jgi:hypothetical protein